MGLLDGAGPNVPVVLVHDLLVFRSAPVVLDAGEFTTARPLLADCDSGAQLQLNSPHRPL
jgi:hypothetical protein